MCGIAGIIDFAGRPIERARLEGACTALAHRGPDDRGIWVHESPGFSAGFAHTRLAVIDPRPEGHQPMLDAAGRWAVAYNGELYNYRELRGELAGPLRTESDTEVVLQACAQWGADALPRFDGMWALAAVDTANRCGHISRDPYGIKPLYYACHGDRLVFASEIASLRGLERERREIDPEAVALYLHLGYIPHPRSIYRGVYKLPPGYVLEFDARGPRTPRRYHQLVPAGGTAARPLPYGAAARELRARVEQAVLSQRVADVPLGAFLSGGLDSTIVAGCLASAGGPAVKTFSIGYAEHPTYDETAYARLAAEHFHTEHHAFSLTFADVLAAVEPMLDHLGEPFADSSLLPASLVSRYTREHVTVALSGDGGDELFGGYWRYQGHHYLERYQRLPAVVRKGLVEPLLRLAPSGKSTRWMNRLRQARKLLRGDLPDPLARHIAWARFMEAPLAAALLGVERADAAVAAIERLMRTAAAELGYPASPTAATTAGLEEILRADLGLSLPDDMLFKVDVASMYHSLEVRVPLLSKGLVDFVSGLPIEYKLAGGQGKRILRDAFRDLVPSEILTRKKMGFEVPVGEFLRHELRDMYHDVVRADALEALGVNPAAAARVYAAHAARREDYTELLWSMLVLCWWRRKAMADCGWPIAD